MRPPTRPDDDLNNALDDWLDAVEEAADGTLTLAWLEQDEGDRFRGEYRLCGYSAGGGADCGCPIRFSGYMRVSAEVLGRPDLASALGAEVARTVRGAVSL